MKKISLCLLLLCVFFPITGCYSKQDKAAEKTGNTTEVIWDFGQVKQGTILRHAFRLKNETTKPLKILSVQSSCGCTTSKVQKQRLSPQESTLIKVTFNTKGYSGSTQQYIYVNTDNLDNPIIRYIIKADVVRR